MFNVDVKQHDNNNLKSGDPDWPTFQGVVVTISMLLNTMGTMQFTKGGVI